MSKTLQQFLCEIFGSDCVLAAGDHAVCTDGIVRAAVGDLLDECLLDETVWDGYLLRCVNRERASLACGMFFEGMDLASGDPFAGTRGETRIYRAADGCPDEGFGYRCTIVDVFGSAFVAVRSCEITLAAS